MNHVPISWKRNLVAIWLSQFFSIMGFAFCMPFAPFYIQSLGVEDPVALKLWVALFAAATPLALALASPIWGMLSDRYGRRLMMLRAYGSAFFVVLLMGLVQQVESLVLLRFIQGFLTGTVTAAQTMVAVHTPNNRSGLALGLLSSALFSGAMCGAAIGGFFADRFGYRASFLVASGFFVIAFLLTLFGAKDRVVEVDKDEEGRAVGSNRDQLKGAVPILVLIVLIALVRQFDMAFVPLRVQEVHGQEEGAARLTGWLFALASLAGMTGGFLLGKLSDSYHPGAIAGVSALGAGLAMLPQGLMDQFAWLAGGRFVMYFFAGGLDPVFQIWLAKHTPDGRKGWMMGWATTAKAAGWVAAPLAAGWIAATFSIRAIFYVAAVLFFLLIPMIRWTVRKKTD